VLDSDIEIKQLSSATREDFYAVHRAGEYTDFCLCGYWWVASSEGWDDRTEQEAISQRAGLFAQGVSDGYLLYVDQKPVGWGQVYPRDRLPNLVNKFGFKTDADVWCIGCFMLAPQARGKGLARRFLALMLVDLQDRGIKKLQAFPRVETNLSANEAWSGPLSLYEKAGFRMLGEQQGRAIMQLDLPGGVLYE
jgi:GNAT superfamily N-acetyltransferase